MSFRRLRSGLGVVAFLAVATAGAGFAQSGNPNAPPPPPPLNSTATAAPTAAPTTAPATSAPTAVPTAAPLASPSGGPRRGRRAARPAGTPAPEPTDTPAPPQFSNLNGIWEIEVQPLGQRLARYEHFLISQTGSALTGYWEHDPNKTRTPITGTFDGRLIQITADTGAATVSFSGYVESFGDMVGMQRLNDRDAGTAFTAQHRKKEGR